jgi:2-methylisocitrate lyase-like PEP mutase family enzyme
MTEDELELMLKDAIQRELAARQAGATLQQAEAMDEIRQLRLLITKGQKA